MCTCEYIYSLYVHLIYTNIDEDVSAMKVFKDFHTSTKKGMSDAARAVVVSSFICFP
jgi:hypothetical protein